MKKFIYLLASILIVSCVEKMNTEAVDGRSESIRIVDISDFKEDLEVDLTDEIKDIDDILDSLRTVIKEKPNNILDLARIAALLDKKFDLVSNVEDLNESVRFRESVAKKTAIKAESALRNLAQAYIKQHRFKEADSVMQSFTQSYASKESKYLLFDVAMELGQYDKAEQLLTELRSDSDYNYLIRAAKWNDHIGRLDNAILAMEKAMALAEKSGKTSWKLWTYSNIADYYGHNGQIKESYDHFLKTLDLSPGNTYALKGISWIAYSNDRDPVLSLDILNSISGRHPSPDYMLSKAEILEFQGEMTEANQLKKDFVSKINSPSYGNMYNVYLIEQLVEGEIEDKERALNIARREIKNRATPETYDLLGYALLKNDLSKEALENHLNHVIGKTYEPVAQLHTAEIYKANDRLKDANELKLELLEASYEMGPVTMKQVSKI